MKLMLFEYTCLDCGHRFRAAELLPLTYGFYLARSLTSDECALLKAIDDPIFPQVERILAEAGLVVGLDDIQKAQLLLRVFGKTCDPASDGSEYAIAQQPTCPKCRRRDRLSWRATDPPEFCEIELPVTTHHRWSGLSEDDRRTIITSAAKDDKE